MAMSISTHLLLPYSSEDFPLGTIPNGLGELRVTWDEILWSALTLGRPSVHHVFEHGPASDYEAVFRISLVRMALEQFGPAARRLRRTRAYKSLDPTEKGAISYFLGMTFCKLFAWRLLDVPWLLHLDIYKTALSALYRGRSRPDLFGKTASGGAWHAFETKGRASRPSTSDLNKAKAQSLRLVSVDGTPCTLHVGTFTYFAGDALNFLWIDPPPEAKRPVEVPDVGSAWRYYYAPVHSLWRGSDASGTVTNKAGEIVVARPDFDVEIRIHPLLAPMFLLQEWERAQHVMEKSQEELRADGFQPDGVSVRCGPSWPRRRSSVLEFG
jgi:hypothetical protein